MSRSAAHSSTTNTPAPLSGERTHRPHPARSLAQVPRYDTHCVFVEDGPCTPCPPERWDAVTTYSELVFFENAAVLPRFVLFFTLR